MSIGQNIKKLRKIAGLSQEKLAQKAGISYHTILRAEVDRPLNMDNLEKIAQALGVRTSYLLDENSDSRPSVEMLVFLANQMDDDLVESLVSVAKNLIKNTNGKI